jgi:hypothetical protein
LTVTLPISHTIKNSSKKPKIRLCDSNQHNQLLPVIYSR